MDKNQFQIVFDGQILILKDRGCPEIIVSELIGQREWVLSEVSKITIAESRIPFLPVVPPTFSTIFDQMSRLYMQGEKGCNFLDPLSVGEREKTLSTPYYIFDVEDGEETYGLDPRAAREHIKKQSRCCLTAVEVISLGTHTDVLSRRNLYATGSSFGAVALAGLGRFLPFGGIPDRSRFFNGPRLDECRTVGEIGSWGSPSCVRRVRFATRKNRLESLVEAFGV